MARGRFFCFIAAAVVVVAAQGVFGAAAAPVATGANVVAPETNVVVTDWNMIAASTLTSLPGPAGGAPPATQINMAMVQGAVYDAVNATTPKHYRPYLLKRRFAATASTEAAVATAAHQVLSHIVSTVPASITFANRTTLLSSLASQHAAALGAIPESRSKAQGVAAGQAAAAAMIAARQGDGRFGPSQWVPSSAVGHWQPLVNTTGQPLLDPTPWVGGVTPFLLQSASQFRTAGPPALDSAQYTADFNEVKDLGSATSATRTATQTYIARWWQSSPVGIWNAVARDLVGRSDLDAAESARLFAMLNLTAADTGINCWNDKYHFDFWRPWNAIPRADDDGNPLTSSDTTWSPLFSAPYPEHPSGHLCQDGAYTSVLRMFFGDLIGGGFSITSASTLIGASDPRTRSFASLSEAVDEIVEARIWAGLHFRTADVQAVTLGANVASYMAANYFQPVGNH
jgi:hypothetical protein